MARVRLAMVEDSDEDFAAYQRALRGSPVEIERWASGEAALEAFDGGDSDLSDVTIMTVDLHLPGIDGIEVVRRVRALPGGGSPKIYMLTSSEIADDEQQAIAAGVDGYVVKPSDLKGLRSLAAHLTAALDGREPN